MCGFNVLKKIFGNLNDINFHCQKRGPDHTNIKEINGITYYIDNNNKRDY